MAGTGSRRVEYSFNPYTFARVSVMKNLLLRKEDYGRMMKMGYNEIIKLLQEGTYKAEINQLAIRYSGTRLLEYAMNKHISNISQKLKAISDSDTKYILSHYFRRYDIWNLKILIRAKMNNAPWDEIEPLLIPAGILDISTLERIFNKDSIRQMIASSGIVETKEIKDELFSEPVELENSLDYLYYRGLASFSRNLPSGGKNLKVFFKHDIDIYNLKLILKSVFYKMDRKKIERYLVPYGKINIKTLLSLAEKSNHTSLLQEIRLTPYRLIEAKKDIKDPLSYYELQLDHFLLAKSILLFYKNPMTADRIIGYMFAKEVEVKNIRAIVKTKMLNRDETQLKNLIITR